LSNSLPAFSIVVNAIEPVNSAPPISGAPSVIATEDSLYVYQPNAFDADGDELTFSISNRPAWASFNTSNGQLTGVPGYGDVGTFSNISISVSDGTASVTTDSFSITVDSANNAPVISGAPMTSVEENSPYSFQPFASDPDGDNLVFIISNRPAWANFDNSNGRLTGAPAEGDAGIYSNIVISVSDGSVTAVLPAFNIQVNAIQILADAGSFTLNWTEPLSRVDNTSLPYAEIDSYRVHYGTSPGHYPNTIDVASASRTVVVTDIPFGVYIDEVAPTQTVTVTDLPLGTYYVVITTKDTDGRESSYSQEIRTNVK
jgi:hypothetical protein